MFSVNQDIEVRIDMSTGTVWRRGTIIDVEFDADNALIYVVRVRWQHLGGSYVQAEIGYTVEDIANGMFRRI